MVFQFQNTVILTGISVINVGGYNNSTNNLTLQQVVGPIGVKTSFPFFIFNDN